MTENEPPEYIERVCRACGGYEEIRNGAWLRWIRRSAGVSIRALARSLRMSHTHLSMIERGKRGLTTGLLNRAQRVLAPKARKRREG